MKNKIRILRIAYWAGAILDAIAFFQMMFPEFSARALGGNFAITPEYKMALQIGASLMLAWTLLLIWADRKPVERRAILPITLIIIVMNFITFVQATYQGLIPFEKAIVQLSLITVIFFLFVFAWINSRGLESESA